MSGFSVAWAVPIVVAVITAMGAFIGIVWKASGRIGTTEASKLWDEATELRTVYKGEVTSLREEVKALTAEVDQLEQHNDECQREIRRLRYENEDLQREVNRMGVRGR